MSMFAALAGMGGGVSSSATGYSGPASNAAVNFNGPSGGGMSELGMLLQMAGAHPSNGGISYVSPYKGLNQQAFFQAAGNPMLWVAIAAGTGLVLLLVFRK